MSNIHSNAAKSEIESNPEISEAQVEKEIEAQLGIERGPPSTGSPPATLDWDDETDADNPLNWPAWKTMYGTLVPALLAIGV